MIRIEAIAIGRPRPRQEQACAILMLSSTSNPLGNQAALVFGHRSSNLKKQLIIGILAHGSLQEMDLTAVSVQFLNEQHLMHILACQPIRGGDDHLVKAAIGGLITQALQTWTTQRRSAVAFIAKDLRVLPGPLLGLAMHL